ncbi:MTMR14 [Cordylochernes scorpioides]|uniref:MTMR14 n=1 Tax=Cordylochernes scorpioides TaxID=51811 RepID=A0ABY6KIS9_9ARAC|nr:MTMR14 [Cordylochernes scorpioides]
MNNRAEINTENSFEINFEEIYELLKEFSPPVYDVKNDKFLNRCQSLFERDYEIITIPNKDWRLCYSYPSRTGEDLIEAFKNAPLSRCRNRFPVPSILINGRYVCRSATLSGQAEIAWKKIPFVYQLDYVDEARMRDIELLSRLKVRYICDLMVEDNKIKYGLPVSSSEKADTENRYKDFDLLVLPYPGCELFAKLCEKGYKPINLVYDWQDPINTVDLKFSENLSSLGVKWEDYEDYRSWNMLEITQNYLKAILTTLCRSRNGFLVHCISGWDRTPLFISLIRLSLWADGLIHASLTPHEILYLTLAYDWFLFGHQYEARMAKREEIMFFCFKMLKYITSSDFSMQPTETKREQRLLQVYKIFIDIYFHRPDSSSYNSWSAYLPFTIPW